MKTKSMIMCSFLLVAAVGAQAEMTAEDLIQAVEEMSPEQVATFQRTLRERRTAPDARKRYFRGKALDLGFSYAGLNRVNLDAVTLSAGDMDIDRVRGIDLGLLWRKTDRFLLGFRFGNWTAEDSNLNENGYTRADIKGGYFSLALNYQIVQSDSWLLWAEVAPGFGSVDLTTVNTPSGEATTLRYFDDSFFQTDLHAGISWRCTKYLTVFLSGGYRFAESVNLDEGGSSSDVSFDASGFTGKWGLGLNF